MVCYAGADRSDSIFSWDDLGPTSTTGTARLRAWLRLLASVGINSLAPQDVNWFERNNFLLHLDELEVLGNILREFAIR
jgi:alpha-glucuronidase